MQNSKVEIKSMLVRVNRWTNSRGNTYHSVYISINGLLVAFEEFEYGFGDSWRMTAQKILTERGIIEEMSREQFSRFMSSSPHYYVVVRDVEQKRQL